MSEEINEMLEIDPNKSNNNKKQEGFLSFRKMITPTLVKILYILGLIGFSLGGLIMIFGDSHSRTFGDGVFIGIMLLTFGNLLWRVLCEQIIVIHSIHEILASIEDIKRSEVTNP